jgi:hypothetical protein
MDDEAKKHYFAAVTFSTFSANNLVDAASMRAKAIPNSFGRENSIGLTVDATAFR